MGFRCILNNEGIILSVDEKYIRVISPNYMYNKEILSYDDDGIFRGIRLLKSCNRIAEVFLFIILRHAGCDYIEDHPLH